MKDAENIQVECTLILLTCNFHGVNATNIGQQYKPILQVNNIDLQVNNIDLQVNNIDL